MKKGKRDIKETKVLSYTPAFEGGDWTGENGGYFSLPNSTIEAIAMKGLTASEMLVYLYMLRMGYNNDGEFYHSYNNMARKLNRGTKSIQNAVKKLEELGLIQKTKIGGSVFGQHISNEYKVYHLVLKGHEVPASIGIVKKKNNISEQHEWCNDLESLL
ncbi:Helix-turn-helix domain-containing protein [Clostridium sp. DSM 8431]|uniref:helix-turn-helix domain-containing protein n=1 Tax=Clostridium sp. DSM 8431 TaxID=1761781 RepID=UPI0008F25C7B|nr:helix-turn-helix domain-containing protein [Clostridium sp. DSM 8431]SFU33987.1 Helix-turn-helix domain-containing protein [Clostridium sp. DSM 8431]